MASPNGNPDEVHEGAAAAGRQGHHGWPKRTGHVLMMWWIS